MTPSSRPIGVFDSGVGGISVLKKLMQALPHENFVYYGDIFNAPYGTKEISQVQEIACNAVRFLIEKDVKAIAVGCNTATTTSLPLLKEKFDLPILGVAPPLEEAQAFLHGGKILVMATPATLKSPYFSALQHKFSSSTLSLPCPGLMELVEEKEIDTPRLHEYLSNLFLPIEREQIDCIVLGCTHYPFVQKAIAKHFLQPVSFMDSAFRVAQDMKNVLSGKNLLSSSLNQGEVCFFTSGSFSHLQQMKDFLTI